MRKNAKRNRQKMPVNTLNLVGQFLFCQWKHNEGFQQNWLRRITRQTATQYICDCQHVLLRAKTGKDSNSTADFLYGIFQSSAQRFRMVKGKLISQFTNLSNPDGQNHVTLISDIKSNSQALLCPLKETELFNIDLRSVLPPDSRTLKSLNHLVEYMSKDTKLSPEDLQKKIYLLKYYDASDSFQNCYGETIKHLEDLFHLPVFKLNDCFSRIDTTHEQSIYSRTACHYHINHHGDDKRIISFDEHYNNITIAFWLFTDKVVFTNVEGIDSW